MRRCKSSTVIGAMALTWMGSAVAAEPGPRELYERGADAYRAGRYEEAVELLGRAQRLEPHPELAYDLGRAYEGAGDAKRAIECYRDYLRLSPDAKDRAAIEARIADLAASRQPLHVKLTVASRPEQATVAIDGHVVGTTPWKGAIATGAHRIALRRSGYADAARDVVVQEGQKFVLYLDLEAEQPAVAAAAPPRSEGPFQKIRLPTWIAAGIGAGALGTSAAFQVAAASAEEDAENAATQLEHRDHYATAEQNRDLARVFLGVGVAAMVTSGVLLTIDLTRNGEGPRRESRSHGVRLQMGIQRAQIEGWFQ